MIRPALILVAAVAAAACGLARDTPEGFTASTGIPLCKEARVERTNKDDPARSSGFTEVYLFRVEMSDRCAADFRQELERASGERCEVKDSCHVITREGLTIGATKSGGAYEIVAVG